MPGGIEEKTLAELRADALRSNMKMTMISPRIENPILATDTSSADIRHSINMLQPKLPGKMAEVASGGPFPSAVSNLMVMDALSLEAPENILANLREEIDGKKPIDGLTYRQAIASFDKQILDTDVFTPMVYRRNPQYIKQKTILRRLIKLIFSRAVGEERERLLQWLKRTIQDVRQTFKEEKRDQPKGGGIPFLTKR